MQVRPRPPRGPKTDLSGKVIGNWLVLSYADKTYWNCKCLCGIIRKVLGMALRNGESKGCGCTRRAYFSDLAGKSFGLLTVISDAGSGGGGGKLRRWLCLCECGAEKVIRSSSLVCGNTRSCGCLAKEAHFRDLTGMAFGRLTVLWDAGPPLCDSIEKTRQWMCRCTCGTEMIVPSGRLVTGNTASCGCLFVERRARRGGKSLSPELQAWRSMIRRCCKENDISYRHYGGRGIEVCDRWLGPDGHLHFLKDMGPKPSRHYTIDRIDNEQGYARTNCRWATFYQQSRNKRNNRNITFNGETHCLQDWGRIVGVSPGVIWHRLRSGWPVKEALTRLLRNRGYRIVTAGSSLTEDHAN